MYCLKHLTALLMNAIAMCLTEAVNGTIVVVMQLRNVLLDAQKGMTFVSLLRVIQPF